MTEIQLNKRNKTIKIVNRKDTIRLQHTGRTGPTGDIGPIGPQGPQGLPVSVNNIEHINGNIDITPDNLDDTSTAHKFVTSTDLTKLSNLSGINTGDETQSTIKTKLGAATSTSDGYATATQVAKLAGIMDGAEVNVQADWSAVNGDAQILNKPTLGTAAAKDIPATGNASATEVVYGTDTRLTDSRPASDVSAWAKTPSKPTYTNTEVGAAGTVHTHVASDISDFNSNVSNNTDVSANTAARHTHSNKTILDATSASYTTADETKLDGIEAGAQVNTVTSVAGKTGAVTLDKTDVGLSNVDNTSDANKPVSTATQTALNGKQNADATLTALAAHNTNGILTQTAADTFTGRTITGTANQVTVTNGNGVAGNPTLSLPQNIHTGATPTFGSVTVTDDAYASGWNGSSVVPTKNAVYDKIEALNADKTSIDYIASRGPSLVTNGQALLGNNYNFSLYTLDKTDKPTGAAGSFVAPVGASATNLDEFMAINPARIYEMSFAVRQAAGDGARVFYSYLAPYDIDKLLIEPYHYMEQAGTRTTLAAPLNPGDTTVTLTSSANWNNAAGSYSHLRTITVWNYVDGQGYAWPVGTYSRNSRMNSYNDGAISGNVITLSTPWGLPAAPAGTAISNGSSGGSYMYGANNVLGPSTWTNYAYKYSGIHSNNAVSATTSFPIATAYVKAGFLRNYPASPANPTSIQKFANVALVDITEANNKLPLAGGTMTGVLGNTLAAFGYSATRSSVEHRWGIDSSGNWAVYNQTAAAPLINIAPDGKSFRIGGSGDPGIFRGTGFPEGVISAPTGSIYIDTAVTNGASSWTKKSGTGNTGWIIDKGDTGWRDITALFGSQLSTTYNPNDYGVYIRRKDEVVTINFKCAIGTGYSASSVGMPAGFKAGGSSSNTILPFSILNLWQTAGSNTGQVQISTTFGFVTFTNTTAGTRYYGSLTYLANDGYPTSLPGTAV